MAGSRTVKTLTALLVAMTLGSLALMILETEPLRPTAQPLAVLSPPPAGAAEVIYETQVPFQAVQWRYVVIHASLDPAGEVARGCHFVIAAEQDGKWKVSAGPHWLHQREGRHIGGYWRDSSIGVCLIGEFSRRPPAAGQLDCLVDLVNTLQEVCGIAADRVYLHRDLDARSVSPGRAFPAAELSARLLRP